MNSPDELVLTANLCSPELRLAATMIVHALEDLDAAMWPPRGESGHSTGKPGSRPPAGNQDAARLARRIATRTIPGIVSEIERLHRMEDADERQAAREFRNMRRRVSAENGKLVARKVEDQA